MNEPAIRQLIERIVTGDGQQLENLTMTDAEWQAIRLKNVDITMGIDDWLALVRIARGEDL